MPLTLEQAAGQHFLLSFTGKQQPPPELLAAIQRQQTSGVVLFRAKNMGTLEELRSLTDALQRASYAASQQRLLIAADQEGGQLMAIGDATPFPGNLALGAARSEKLAYRVGQAMGRELAALGINIDFAPVCDVNNNPANPVVGTRSFGEDPKLVARLAASMVQGLQSAGIAATAKHFPGHGDTASDSHHAAPVLPHNMKRVSTVELPPFQSAIAAGVRLVMTAHIVFPALNGGTDTPATLSPQIIRGLLRRRLRFNRVVVTDAMDMNAMEQGPGYAAECMAALAAGVDLLLFNHDLAKFETAYATVLQAARRGLLSADEMQASATRVTKLRKWVIPATSQPPLSTVCCEEHQALAAEVAAKAATLVRDTAAQVPIQRSRIAVVVPRPEDLTPADTSSYLVPQLAAAARRYEPNVDEVMIPMNPDNADVRAIADRIAGHELAIVGTINAAPGSGQAALVNALLERGTPVIAVALRMPYDLAAYPSVATYACTYSILPPAMNALADSLWGKAPFPGRLPVTV